jgi:hypothetical protein
MICHVIIIYATWEQWACSYVLTEMCIDQNENESKVSTTLQTSPFSSLCLLH